MERIFLPVMIMFSPFSATAAIVWISPTSIAERLVELFSLISFPSSYAMEIINCRSKINSISLMVPFGNSLIQIVKGFCLLPSKSPIFNSIFPFSCTVKPLFAHLVLKCFFCLYGYLVGWPLFLAFLAASRANTYVWQTACTDWEWMGYFLFVAF